MTRLMVGSAAVWKEVVGDPRNPTALPTAEMKSPAYWLRRPLVQSLGRPSVFAENLARFAAERLPSPAVVEARAQAEASAKAAEKATRRADDAAKAVVRGMLRAAAPPPAAPRPPFDRMSGLSGAQLEELQRWEAKHPSPERLKLEERARKVGLDEDEIKRLGDRDLEEAIRRHKISDGHGKDAVPYPKPLPPRKKEEEDDDDKAIAAARAASMSGEIDDCPRLAPHVLASLRGSR